MSTVAVQIGIALVTFGLSMLFRPTPKGPEEPKPGNLRVQSSTRGAAIPVVLGNRKLGGNLIWYGNFKQHRHETEHGGKGGGSSVTSVHYTYTVSFAFAVCMGEAHVLRIWRGKDEIVDWRINPNIRVYSGTTTQTPDPHIAHFVPRAPAYRNVCYVVFENFNLGEQTFLPNFNFEISKAPIIPEGTNWVERASPKKVDLLAVTWTGSKVVAVGGYDGTVFTSDDHGVTWAERSTPKRAWLDGVTWTGSKVVAVGGYDGVDYYIITSDDHGVTWTERASPLSIVGLMAVTWTGSKVVAVDNWGSVITSDDHGETWTWRGQLKSEPLSDVTWTGSKVVVVGGYGSIFTSDDHGVTWTERANPTGGELNGVTWTGSRVVAVGGWDGAGKTRIITSDDHGATWTDRSWPNTGLSLHGATWTGSRVVAVGNPGVAGVTVITSDDHGVTWTERSAPNLTSLHAVTWTGSKVVAVGSADHIDALIITSEAEAPPVSEITPPEAVQTLLTNGVFGRGIPLSKLDTASFDATKAWCETNDIRISPLIDTQLSVLDFVESMLSYHNGYITWQNGKIYLKQIKTETVTQTIDVDVDVIAKDIPVDIDHKPQRDVPNKLRIEYTKRDDQYTTGVVVAEDEVHQTIHGVKERTVRMEAFTTPARAIRHAYTVLKRNIEAPSEYNFAVGPRKASGLAPGSVVALTDAQMGIINQPVRITQITEGRDYIFSVRAVDETDYVLDPRAIPSEERWIQPVVGGAPGWVRGGAIIEFPSLLTQNQNIVGIQYSSSGKASWAGATIHRSWDNINYDLIHTSYGSGLTGTVNSVTPDTITVTVTDDNVALNSVVDVFALLTQMGRNLCWVHQANAYFRFTTATLVAPAQWRLSGIIRDAKAAPTLSTHGVTAGQTISFLDYLQEPIPVPVSMDRLDRDFWIKIPSFNFFGESEDISAVPALKIKLGAVGVRPIAPQNLEVNGNVTRVPAGDIVLRWMSANRSSRGLIYTRTDQIAEDLDFLRFDVTVRNRATNAVLRVASTTGVSWTYTSAMQAADGGPTMVTFEIEKVSNIHRSLPATLEITIV